MNLGVILLTAAITLLQLVIANPSDPQNAQRIHFAEAAFELSNYYQSQSTTTIMDTPNQKQQVAPQSPESSSSNVMQTLQFVGTPTVENLGNNLYKFNWESNIPSTGEVWLYANSAQIDAFNSGNYEGGIMQTPIVDATTNGEFQLSVGSSFPYALIIRSEGQQEVFTGKLNQ